MTSELLAQDDRDRISVLQAIQDNLGLILASSMTALSQYPEELIQKNSKVYINHHLSSFCDDMISILKYITSLMFKGHPESKYVRSFDSLKRKYISLGVPIADIIKAVASLKDVTIDVLASDEGLIDLLSDSELILVGSEHIESISKIKKKYCYMWVTVEVTELERGFPNAGKVILASKNRSKIAEDISKHYRNVKTYTFFCGDLSKEESRIKTTINRYLEPYFDSVMRKLGDGD